MGKMAHIGYHIGAAGESIYRHMLVYYAEWFETGTAAKRPVAGKARRPD
jgi:hypothetical protein